jgi:iron(III) transport system ATP-binding protein
MIEDLRKTFPSKKRESHDVHAVDGVSLDIKEGEFFTLLGPSGCGKTTTLRSVAGLEQPTSGRITVGDHVLFDSDRGINVRVNARGLGMVFQSYAIWPHMNVFRNVAFPLTVRPRARRPSRAQIRENVERVLRVVHLDHLMDRPATDLSGGQQQRLALARALIMEPPLLLLDEPLSNLDAKLREQMRFELKRLQRDLNITAVYVTHDQVEALTMSNRIAVMHDGKVEQLGKPRDIYNAPSSRFVADFIGTSNFCEGKVSGHEGDEYRIETAYGDLIARSEVVLMAGADVVVSIRPEQLALAEPGTTTPGPGVWPAVVRARGFLGDVVEHELTVGDDLVLRMRSNPEVSLPPGEKVLIELPARWCTVLPV